MKTTQSAWQAMALHKNSRTCAQMLARWTSHWINSSSDWLRSFWEGGDRACDSGKEWCWKSNVRVSEDARMRNMHMHMHGCRQYKHFTFSYLWTVKNCQNNMSFVSLLPRHSSWSLTVWAVKCWFLFQRMVFYYQNIIKWILSTFSSKTCSQL